MDSLEPFVFLEQYRLAVCKKCEFAVVADEVFTHLRVRHKNISIQQRTKISEAAKNCLTIIRDQNDLVGFLYPPPTTTYVPHLAPPQQDGLKCRQCPYIARQLQKIQAHCRTCHDQENNRTAGRPDLKRKISPEVVTGGASRAEAQKQLPWRENVACQRFFPSRRASGWFEIGRLSLPPWAHPMYAPQTLTAAGAPSAAPSTKRPRISDVAKKIAEEHISAVLHRRDQYLKKQNESRLYAKALGEDSLAAISPWLDRTGVRRDILKAMTSTAKTKNDLFLGQGEKDGDADVSIRRADKQKLACVLAAVDLMLDRCEMTARHTSRLIRCWLVTSKPNSYQSNAFSVMTESNTRYRYRQTWKKFIAFVVRAWLLPTQTRRQIKVGIPAEI